MKKPTLLLAATLAMTMATVSPALAEDVTQVVGGQEAKSGDVTTPFSVTNSGNSSNQCASAEQSANTGNNQPAQGALQFGSGSGDIGFGGGSISSSPKNAQQCEQAIQQSAAASSSNAPGTEQQNAPQQKKAGAKATTPKEAEAKVTTPKEVEATTQPVPPQTAEAKAGEVTAKAEAPKAEAPETRAVTPKAQAKAEQTKVEQTKVETPKAETKKAEENKAERKTLPNTGGMGGASLLALGALLVGGGLLVRKAFR